jgi:beta-lactamase class C
MGKTKQIYLFIGLTIILASTIAFYSATRPTASNNDESEPAIEVVTPTAVYEVEVTSSNNPYILEVLNQYESFINHSISKEQAPGAAVAIVKDSSIIFLKGFGLKQIGQPDSININTVFRLGSVSKCFSSVVTGTLVSDHILNWDDQVIKYLPDFKLKSIESTQKLTLRHVLSHTIGLPYHAFTNMIEEKAPIDTLYHDLRNLDLIDEPGKVYSYQNVGFSLIGEVIKSATQKSFEEILKEKLFLPLHMMNSSASYISMISNDNIAKPHLFKRKHWSSIPISETYYDTAPAGGVNASIADMALWLKALLGNNQEIINDTTLNEIFTPQIRANSRNREFRRWKRPKGSYYALGWRVLTFKNDTIEYHGGYVNGFRSEVALDRKNKIAICVLTNSSGSLADQSIPEFFSKYSKLSDSINKWDSNNKVLLVGKQEEINSTVN